MLCREASSETWPVSSQLLYNQLASAGEVYTTPITTFPGFVRSASFNTGLFFPFPKASYTHVFQLLAAATESHVGPNALPSSCLARPQAPAALGRLWMQLQHGEERSSSKPKGRKQDLQSSRIWWMEVISALQIEQKFRKQLSPEKKDSFPYDACKSRC